jgi:Putative beta-barrel porin-2, OmpL-like. bbp2
MLPPMLVLGITIAQTPRTQAQTQPNAPTKVAAVYDTPSEDAVRDGGTPSKPVSPTAAAPDPEISPAVAKELAAMKAEIEQLKVALKSRVDEESAGPAVPATASAPAPAPATIAPVGGVTQQATDTAAKPDKPEPSAPFAYADWTWLNGNPRNKDAVWDSKFFTPEIRFDADFISSFNHPKDDSLGGSTEIFRSNEVQLEQISFGGDFHWQNVRGRVLTMGGMFAVTTPRNDASVGRGQWDLRGAYKYFSEAYGGYHFDVNHGLNIDAGIFVSYIGLFSYYNFDNWAYQPSYVSSNTPWFFNGVRIQWFPTDKLKIEPWIINGWQSYGRFGTKPGLGGQILWRPKPWISMVFNNYGMGEDTLWTGNVPIGRSRIHTDDSVEIKYYDHPEKFLDKMAFSFTADLGCEYGGGVSCHKNKPLVGTKGGPKQSFAGWMLYNRWWFKKDQYALTLGGGVLDNPGRYLTLLPPINGADAVSGSPYFPASPGSVYKAWDNSVTFDWMPRQYITFLWEYGYRHANVPYFTGRGGITPPAGNNGSPAEFVCMDNTPDPTGAGCSAHGGLWSPDLRKDEPSLRMAIMVKF